MPRQLALAVPEPQRLSGLTRSAPRRRISARGARCFLLQKGGICLKLLQRGLALLLALCLPALAVAQENAHGLHMTLSFDMDAAAYPEEATELMTGIADAVDLLGIEADLRWRGDLLSQDTSFDAQATLSLGELTQAAQMRIYGVPSHIALESNLLGDQTVMLNMLAWEEFALKAYFQLGLPLYRIAPYVSTYAHACAFEALAPLWDPVMHAQPGSRTIPREDVLDMLAAVGETAPSDRSFVNWLQALTLDTGCDEIITETLYTAADWADSFLDEEGITVTQTGDSERWQTGETVLFSRQGESWSFALPASPEGYQPAADVSRTADGLLLNARCGLDAEDDLLSLCASLTGLPQPGETSGTAQLTLDITGEMLSEAHLRWQFDWQRTTDANGAEVWNVTAVQTHHETGAQMLTISAVLTPYTPDSAPDWTAAEIVGRGFNIFSVYEETLSQFVSAIEEPFLAGMLPILSELPISSYQSLFSLLEEYGVLGLLTDSAN